MKTSRIRNFFSRGFGSASGLLPAPALARSQAARGARATPVPGSARSAFRSARLRFRSRARSRAASLACSRGLNPASPFADSTGSSPPSAVPSGSIRSSPLLVFA